MCLLSTLQNPGTNIIKLLEPSLLALEIKARFLCIDYPTSKSSCNFNAVSKSQKFL